MRRSSRSSASASAGEAAHSLRKTASAAPTYIGFRHKSVKAVALWRGLRLFGALAALEVAFSPTPASAHALLLATTPAAGTVSPADSPPRVVSLQFSEPIEVAFNAIAVLDSGGRRVDRLDAHAASEDPRRVDVEVGDSAGAGLAQGAYLIRWRVTSVDNHLVGGSLWFAVGFAAALPQAALIGAGAPTIAPFEAISRWLALLSLLPLAGASFFLLLVLRPTRARLPPAASGLLTGQACLSRLWLASIAVFVGAHLLWAVAQTEAGAELPLPLALDGP